MAGNQSVGETAIGNSVGKAAEQDRTQIKSLARRFSFEIFSLHQRPG
jgi:hypothetical protein